MRAGSIYPKVERQAYQRCRGTHTHFLSLRSVLSMEQPSSASCVWRRRDDVWKEREKKEKKREKSHARVSLHPVCDGKERSDSMQVGVAVSGLSR